MVSDWLFGAFGGRRSHGFLAPIPLGFVIALVSLPTLVPATSCLTNPAVQRGHLDEPGEPFRIGGGPVHGAEGAFRSTPAAAFDGTNYLVVWEEERCGTLDIFAARVSEQGVVLDPGSIAVSSGPSGKRKPCVAFDGINYLVVWSDERSGSWDIYGARVSKGCAVLDPMGIAIAEAPGIQSHPSVAFGGSTYLVVWSDERSGWTDIYGARLDVEGSVLDEEGILISPSIAQAVPTGPWGPSVASDGSGFMVVWQAFRQGTWNVYGARVSASGEVLDPDGMAVAATEEEEWYPCIANSGSNYLIVWHAVSGGSFDLFGARVSSAGLLLDGERIAISEHRFWQRYPAVASDGENYMVTWANWTAWSQDVYATAVTSDGEIVDMLGAPVLHAERDIQWRPALAFGVDSYLVVSQDERTSSGGDIHGVLVNRSGGLITETDIGISTEGDGPWRPSVSFDGSGYMVVWGDIVEGSGRAMGARVSAEGSLLDADAVLVSSQEHGAYAPKIAFDGVNHMVVWQDDRGGTWDIYGSRMSRLGTVLDTRGVKICAEDDGQRNPSVAFGAGSYLVVWEDWRSAAWDIHGARVSPAGVVLDPDGIAISTSARDQRRPSVAFDGVNFVVVWEDSRNGGWDVFGARITTAGEILDADGIAVCAGPDDQWTPAIASEGAGCLVVWHEWNGGSGDVKGARLNADGAVLDPNAITISDESGRQWGPEAAFDGREYVVAWADARHGGANADVYACRVAPSGAVLDPEGVGASTDRSSEFLPAVAACDSAEVLIAYSSLNPSAISDYWRIWGSLWSPPQEDPLVLTLSIHQNPALTSEIDMVLVPSKAVQDTSVWLAVDDTAVESVLSDTAAGIYRGSYRLSGPDVITIAGGARDLFSIAATAVRQFGVGLIERDRGGTATGPLGLISLRFPEAAVDRDSFVLVIPEETGDEFALSPSSLELLEPATLRLKVGGALAAEAAPFLLREGISGWEELKCGYDEASGVLTAQITELGRFRVAWAPRVVGSDGRALHLQTVPNPFRGAAEIRFLLPAAGDVKVEVYDAGGRLVRKLADGYRGPGWHSESWNGLDDAGRKAPAGVYFTAVSGGGRRALGKCVFVR